MEGCMISRAIVFATKAHEGVMRKGSNIPYILHPLETGVIVSGMTTDENVIAAAILHDVLEDTEVTYGELKEKFGIAADLVQAETENKRRHLLPEDTWKIRKQETIEHLQRETHKEIKMIALADKLSNLRSVYQGYQLNGNAFWEKFHEKRKNQHGWYYKEVFKTLSDLKEYPAYKEYETLLSRVFEE